MSVLVKDKPAVRYLVELPLKFNSDDGVLDDFVKEGGRIWCRIPNALQVYFRVVDYDSSAGELKRQYEAQPRSFRLIRLNHDAVKEVFWLGAAEVSESEEVGFLSEDGKIQSKTVSEAAWSAMVTNLRSSIRTPRSLGTIRARAHRKSECFVLGTHSLSKDKGLQFREVVESGVPVRINDLFVSESDYQSLDARFLVDSDGEMQKPDWMPSQLWKLNVYFDRYEALRSKNIEGDDWTAALAGLEADLAAALGESKTDSQKMVVAKRVVFGDRRFYPKLPVQPCEGRERVSLLEIANSLSKHFWRDTVEKTKSEYGRIGPFDDKLSDILKSYNVDRRASLVPNLSRFIRFI